MEWSVNRVISLLQAASTSPLSFVIILPDWQDPPTPSIVTLQKSVFLRHTEVLEGGKHRYISGYQHMFSVDISPSLSLLGLYLLTHSLSLLAHTLIALRIITIALTLSEV